MIRQHQIHGVRVAERFVDRLVGLMGRRELSNACIWFPRCASIHTWFMRGPIDILFLDDEGRVIDRHARLAPWKVRVGSPGSRSVLELPAGFVEQRGIRIGDRVTWA